MKAALHNLGCKTNSYETQAMEQALKESGYEIVPFGGDDPADIYVINTCSVTNIADRKSRQMIHKARTLNPAAVIVAVGCFVQTSDLQTLEKEGIDICLGSNDKGHLLECLNDHLKNGQRVRIISDLMKDREYEALSVNKRIKHTRAYIKIEDGCDQFCSFCIIPYARGRVRSRDQKAILQEADSLAKAGVKEIVLTGINMSAYGSDLKPVTDLGELLLKLQDTVGVERIRLSSVEPRIITEEFLEKIRPVTKLCPHFHLSLQSGSDTVLRRMNRHYTTPDYSDKCDLLRKYYEKPSITTDIITGFPGETESEFEETLSFVQKIDFFDIHVFAFSPREGTPAAKMPRQTDARVKRLRSSVLIQKAAEMKNRHLLNLVEAGSEYSENVLIEETQDHSLPDLLSFYNGTEYYMGHTSRYVKVLIPKIKDGLEGEIVKIKVKKTVFLSDGSCAVAGVLT